MNKIVVPADLILLANTSKYTVLRNPFFTFKFIIK